MSTTSVGIVSPALAGGHLDLLSSHGTSGLYCGSGIPPGTVLLAGPGTEIYTPYQRQELSPDNDHNNEYIVVVDCEVNPEILAEEFGATLTFHYPHLDNINLWTGPAGITNPEAWAVELMTDSRIIDAYPVYEARMRSGGMPGEEDPTPLDKPMDTRTKSDPSRLIILSGVNDDDDRLRRRRKHRHAAHRSHNKTIRSHRDRGRLHRR